MRARGKLVCLAAAVLALAGAAWAFWPRQAALPAPSQALTAAAAGLDSIVIEAELEPEERVLRVTQRMTLQNRTGTALNELVLRTWPNAFQSLETSPCAAEDALYQSCYPDGFSAGALVMALAEVNGESVVYRYTDEARTVLQLPLRGGWPAGETIEVALRYHVQIPRMAYRFGVWDGVWSLGGAFALPSVWEDGAWRTEAYAPVGDPFVSDCANYEVTVAAPEGFVCAGSGWPQTHTAEGRTVFRFQSQAVRDFALVLSDRFRRAQAVQNGVLITAYAQDAAQARELLRYARAALAFYEARYGRYPYPSYTLAETALPLGGMEYPALSLIGAAALAQGGRELEYLTAHETAHQWWYAAVGSDGWYQAWQDEALAAFSTLEYAQSRYGAQERAELERAGPQSAMRVTVPAGVTPGAPLDTFAGMSEYKLVVYDRGAALLCALDELLGEGLNTFLRAYYETFAFGRASRADFEALLSRSTGEDLAPLVRDYLDTQILN